MRTCGGAGCRHRDWCCVMFTLLDVLLRRIVHRGSLTLTDAHGKAHRYGDGSGPPVAVRVTDERLERQLVYDPQLGLGEGYMDGRLKMEQGRIYDLLELVLSNAQLHPQPGLSNGL